MSPLPAPAPLRTHPHHCPGRVPHCCRHRIQVRYCRPPRNRLRRARHPQVTHSVGRVPPLTARARNGDGAELPKPDTASGSSSSSGSPSASSSGSTAVGMVRRWVKQVAEAASAGRSRSRKRVTWSFDVETSTWASGWNVSAQTFESCAWENVARGFAVRVLRAWRCW
jgi:hypothetical protein